MPNAPRIGFELTQTALHGYTYFHVPRVGVCRELWQWDMLWEQERTLQSSLAEQVCWQD